MATTTALVLQEINKPFSLGEVTIDKVRDDEALVEIHATGLCHTDLSCADGTLPASAPAVLGHEGWLSPFPTYIEGYLTIVGAGIVKEVGSKITDLVPGDKVLLSYAHCGACEPCASGHPAYCYSFVPLNFGGKRSDGSSTLYIHKDGERQGTYSSFFGQSSFARHTVVHRSSLIKVSNNTDLALFSPLGCGLQTGAGAILNTLNVKVGKTVAIFGVGSVGMSAVLAAKMRGAKEIIAVDLQQTRLDLAAKLGATQTLLGDDPELVSKIQKLSPPNGVHYAVDCSGIPAVVENMVDCLGTLGKAATVGAPKVRSHDLGWLNKFCANGLLISRVRRRASMSFPISSTDGNMWAVVRETLFQTRYSWFFAAHISIEVDSNKS